MAVLSKDQFFDKIKNLIGADTSQESLDLITDLGDTYNDLANKASVEADVETAVAENDAKWRKLYTERFFATNGGTPSAGAEKPNTDDRAKTITLDELFN
jgi:hypothetical protein